jgi:hypothetical protein
MNLQTFAGSASTSALSPGAQTPVLQPNAPTETSATLANLVEMFQSTQYIANFRKATTWLKTPLKQITLTPGSQVPIDLPNNGLSVYVVSKHVTNITFANGNTSAETVSISPWFPFNMDSLSQVQINGSSNMPFASDGLGILATMIRPRINALVGGGARVAPPLSVVSVSPQSNLTLTASSLFSLSGYQQLSVAASASTNNVLTVTWFELHKLAYSRWRPLGCYPLNNTQLNVQLFKSMGQISGTGATFPFYAVPAGVTITATDTVSSMYYYWGTPSDPALYSEFVSQVYLINQQKGITVNAEGPQALQYNLPLSQYVTALHLFGSDTNGNPVDIASVLSDPRLQLAGGSIVPIKDDTTTDQFLQMLDYGDERSQIPGYFFWDGNDTAEFAALSDDTGWFNTYNASNPAFVADIVGAPATPLNFSFTRESLIDGTMATMYAG